MKPIEFLEQTKTIAKHQPEYIPIPVHHFGDVDGKIAFCWKLSFWERLKILWTGVLWHQVLAFKKPLQPQLLCVNKPEMKI